MFPTVVEALNECRGLILDSSEVFLDWEPIAEKIQAAMAELSSPTAQILCLVLEEREKQLAKQGVKRDDLRNIEDWGSLIEEQLDVVVDGPTDPEAQWEYDDALLVRIAAICIRARESRARLKKSLSPASSALSTAVREGAVQ